MKVKASIDVIIRTEIHTSYIETDDVTVVWQTLLVGDECVQRTLVGWYCGEPEPAFTKQYANLPLIGQYID